MNASEEHLVPMFESLDFFGQVLQYLLHLEDELEKQMEGGRDIINSQFTMLLPTLVYNVKNNLHNINQYIHWYSRVYMD